MVSEFINWSNEAKKPCEKRANGDGGDTVPEKKHYDTTFGDMAFLPSDFGMEDISKNGGKGISDNAVQPKDFI